MWRKLATVVLAAIELNSYCKGVCQARYEDGFYSAGKCACVDYVPVNLRQRFEVPKRPSTKRDASVYDGQDQMHYAPADPDSPPTAPLDF